MSANSEVSHSRAQMINHLAAEVTDDLDTIIDSLLEDGNGKLTWVMPTGPGGGPAYLAPDDISLRVEDTRQRIRGGYDDLHTIYRVLKVDRIAEINGSFYSFIDTLSHLQFKETGDMVTVPGLGLFPSEQGLAGIRGEIMWGRTALEFFGDENLSETNPFSRRREVNVNLHDELIEVYRHNDATGLEKVFAENALLAVRDRVNDSEGVTNHKGRAAVISYYEQLFSRYEVLDVTTVQRLADEWYVFSELRWDIKVRSGANTGKTGVFSTAEFATVTADRNFRAQMGHGTPVVFA